MPEFTHSLVKHLLEKAEAKKDRPRDIAEAIGVTPAYIYSAKKSYSLSSRCINAMMKVYRVSPARAKALIQKDINRWLRSKAQ